MNWDRTLGEAAVVRLARRLAAATAPLWQPVAARLAVLDRWLVSLVRGSWLYAWATADPDPDPVVIDLRTSVLFTAVFAVSDRFEGGWRGSGLARGTDRLTARVEREPVRAASLLLGVLFAASLAASAAAGDLTLVTYLLHAVFLGGSLAGLRERRDWAALRETRTGRVLRALFAPPEE